jgi:hypothetical protein
MEFGAELGKLADSTVRNEVLALLLWVRCIKMV